MSKPFKICGKTIDAKSVALDDPKDDPLDSDEHSDSKQFSFCMFIETSEAENNEEIQYI